jgi:hypothetical protein
VLGRSESPCVGHPNMRATSIVALCGSPNTITSNVAKTNLQRLCECEKMRVEESATAV